MATSHSLSRTSTVAGKNSGNPPAVDLPLPDKPCLEKFPPPGFEHPLELRDEGECIGAKNGLVFGGDGGADLDSPCGLGPSGVLQRWRGH